MKLQLLVITFFINVSESELFINVKNSYLKKREECDVKVEPCRDNMELCDKLCIEDKCNIRAVIILPNDTSAGAVITLSSVIPSLEQAINDAHKEKLLPEWLNITLIPKDDKCSESYAQIGVIEAFSADFCPHVIFGPICEYAVATVSRIMKFYGTPQLSPGGLSTSFENSKLSCDDEYFMFIRTSSIFFKGISQFFKSLFIKYNWKKIVFLYDPDGQKEVAGMKTCSLFMQTLILSLHNIENFQYSDGDVSLSTMNTTEFLKSQIGVNFGVTIMCASYERIRDILLAAASLNEMVTNGEYVFFNIELTSQAQIPEKPWLFGNNTDENDKLKKAYKSVITLTSKTNEQNDSNSGTRTSKFISDFYNSMWLYALAINSTLNGSQIENNYNTKINGYELARKMYGTSFLDKNNEMVQMNCEGSRINEYSLLSYNPNKDKFEVVANYAELNDSITFLEGRKIYWPGGANNPPPDTPTCGYDNSKCPETSLPTYVYISIGLVGFALLIVIIAIFMYRRYKLEAEISSMSWKVCWEDIIDLQNSAIRRDSLSSSIKRGSQVTYASDLYSLAGDNQIFIPIGFYKNSKVAIKKIAPVKNDLSRKQLLHLKQMKDLQHEHLVRFQGACIEAPNYCVLTEYCPKGSLQDILENDQFTLEWMIRISLIQDLVRGMTYLHQSEIKSHGSLSSTNCVVDSRFVLKITDFGLPFFKKLEPPNPDSYAFWRRQLWSAPELLRDPNPPDEGTQKGDIYSFGIIAHEIVMRKGLFYLEDGVEHTPKDIINSIKNYVPDVNVMPLRPYIDHSMIEEEVATLMKSCWNEDPIERPDFPALKNLIKKLNKDHDNGNILDNLLSRMEQYANNLESLVEERTADYLEEKKKCEELLYQLLPKTVASQLIRGQSVIAETFDKVTIYFSDIVGFTSLSASSTPMQVVDLLNDLYTCFDSIIENFDVYKVETIGDAYMVVSGLPVRNGDLHSREIARMSLALLDAVQRFTIRHRPEDKLKLRIGLHSGGCVAGVVGLKMPRYCLFGDTVNTASRMESNGEALKIHISPFTKEALDIFDLFIIERRGDVELKGKGKMTTYWLLGEKNIPETIDTKNSIAEQNNVTTEAIISERRDSKTISWNSNIPESKTPKINVINEQKESFKFPKTVHPTKLKRNNSKNNYRKNITSKF